MVTFLTAVFTGKFDHTSKSIKICYLFKNSLYALADDTQMYIPASKSDLKANIDTLEKCTAAVHRVSKKTSTHIIGYKLRNSCPILIIFDIKIPHII